MSLRALPEEISQWLDAAKQSLAGMYSINSLEDNRSASKITDTQFLALRTLWRGHRKLDVRNFVKGRGGLMLSSGLDLHNIIQPSHLANARALLNDVKSWRYYISILDAEDTYARILRNGKFDVELGAFALVLQLQMQVENIMNSSSDSQDFDGAGTDEFMVWSPGKSAADMQHQMVPGPSDRIKGKSPLDPLSTPTKQLGKISMRDQDLSPLTPCAGLTTPLDRGVSTKLTLSRAMDEQIVNAALIDFLNAITIHIDSTWFWSLHRHAFYSQTYQARVDGYLTKRVTRESPNIVPRIIVEVKADKRVLLPSAAPVRMQESAQMAAWICWDTAEKGCKIHAASLTPNDEEPPSPIRKPKFIRSPIKTRSAGTGKDVEEKVIAEQFKSSDYADIRHRVLISQDKNDIFIIIATYSEPYIEYVRGNKRGEGARDDYCHDEFLHMDELGPFHCRQADDMRIVGEVVLSLVLGQSC